MKNPPKRRKPPLANLGHHLHRLYRLRHHSRLHSRLRQSNPNQMNKKL
jgi:hypothetical protein